MLLISNELLGADLHAADKVFFSDDFETLDTWESLFFNGIDQHTTYVIQVQGDSNVLVAKSSGSASAIACKQTFNVTELPIIRWCWKVDNVYAKGNYRIKSGDDYPIRVYYNVIASKFGMVPNYHKSMANSPVALNAYLKLDAMIAGGSFSPVEDIVRLTVSRYNGCTYCVAAHNICIRRRAITPPHGAKETMNRLEEIVKQRDLNVFARIDHAAGAAKVGQSLRPTELLIFSNDQWSGENQSHAG